VYRQKAIDCGADSQENNAEQTSVTVTDEEFTAAEIPEEAEREEITVHVSDNAPAGICGDGMTAFEYGGKYYMILSDGMGSGREAALTSGIVVSMLEKLICAGAELETALKMLNHIVRTVERECSATVDIAEIDLVSGEARFIKSGAAPSFVLRNGSIFRLQSKTVPIGIIRALDAEMIRFDVEEGDTVVMLSDGAARSYEEVPWLLELMTYDETVLHGDERRAAMTIVSEAAIRGSEDDISAGIVRIVKKAG
jgi:stage II sporulation protein E